MTYQINHHKSPLTQKQQTQQIQTQQTQTQQTQPDLLDPLLKSIIDTPDDRYSIKNSRTYIFYTFNSLRKYKNINLSYTIVLSDKEFISLLVKKLYDNPIIADNKTKLEEHYNELMAQNFDSLDSKSLDKYLIYLCNLFYYISKKLYLLDTGSNNKKTNVTHQTNLNNHLFYPKLYKADTIDFWMNFVLDLNKNITKIKTTHSNLIYYKFCDDYDNIEIIKNKTINWNDRAFVNSGNFNYDIDSFLHKSFIQSGKKTVKEYLIVIKNEYLKILNECETNESCLRGLIQKSYISNISEITSMNKIYEILFSYHNEHYKIYKNMPSHNILPFWKPIFELFLNSNHNSLYDKSADYTRDVDLSKFTYNKDIAKILDTYEFGVRSYIYKFMPTPIQYIVLFLTSYEYDQTLEYRPKLKENVFIINDIIIRFIENDYKKRIEYTKNIIKNFSKVYFYLKQNPLANFNDIQIIRDIKDTNINEPKDFDFKIYYQQNEKYDNNTNYELLFHKLKIHQEIYDLIADFLYINAQSHIHNLEKNHGIINITNKTLVFGNTFLLKRYGFKDVSYIYKINSDVNFGFSDVLRWTIEQNNIMVMNFAKTEKLISGVILIDDNKMPYMFLDFLYNNIENLKLIETIEIKLPLPFDKEKDESMRKYYIHIYYIFFDTVKNIIIILNNRGRIVYPGEILETYAITYRELNILYTYNCNFYKCKNEKFSFLYLVSPAEYSQRLPTILKKLDIYDKFVKNFEPVFIVKDRINTKALIVVKQNLELVSYPATYKELYIKLKAMGDIEFKKSIKENLPFHSQFQAQTQT